MAGQRASRDGGGRWGGWWRRAGPKSTRAEGRNWGIRSASRPEGTLDRWLADDADPKVLIAASCDLSAAMPGARLVAPPPTLGALERQLSAAWVTGAARADGRYVLAEKRLSRPAQAKFDVVLINAPPRLSIGAINALTAATHLVIPTTVDRVSCEAVATFVELYEALKPALFPQLALAGWYWRGRARTRG